MCLARSAALLVRFALPLAVFAASERAARILRGFEHPFRTIT